MNKPTPTTPRTISTANEIGARAGGVTKPQANTGGTVANADEAPDTAATLTWSMGFLGLACASGVVGFAWPVDSPALESLGGALFITWMVASLVALMFDSPAEA